MSGDLKQSWYLQLQGECYGPFAPAQLSHYLLLRRLNGESLVSRDGEHWQRLAELPELQPEYRLGIAALPESEQGYLEATQQWVAQHPSLFPQDGEPGASRDGGRVLRATTNRPLAYAVVLLILLLVVSIPFFAPSPDAPQQSQCEAVAAPGVVWSGCHLPSSRLEGADLRQAQLVGANLSGSQLSSAQMQQADLGYAKLALSDMRGAQLQGARLIGSNLRNVDLRGADLSGADLSYADLTGARLEGANLANTHLGNAVWEENMVCMPESRGRCIPAQSPP